MMLSWGVFVLNKLAVAIFALDDACDAVIIPNRLNVAVSILNDASDVASIYNKSDWRLLV